MNIMAVYTLNSFSLNLKAHITYKGFSLLLSYAEISKASLANNVDPEKTAPIGAV